jgi:flavin reductase (DIM6/NTAB) family NADH-FMN oxidoreductase RutF
VPRMIGYGQIAAIDRHNRRCQLGITIGDKSRWGQGYAREALVTVITYAFEELQLHRIAADAYDFNLRSIRLFEGLGFRREGALRQHVRKREHFADELQYSLLRDEWDALRDSGWPRRPLESEKVRLGPRAYVYPVPIVLAGALVNGRPNYVTLGDCGIVGLRPPLVYISSHRDHFTNLGILDHGTFSINFPTTGMLNRTDYCGNVSGRDVDKGALFETFFGSLGTAPLIRECPVNLECHVVKDFCIEQRQVFVGEVVETHVSLPYLRVDCEGQHIADLTRLDPICYALDNRYYRIGAPIGAGYEEGVALRAPFSGSSRTPQPN